MYIKYLDNQDFKIRITSFSRCNLKNLLRIRKLGYVNKENYIISEIPVNHCNNKILWNDIVGKYIEVKYKNENNKIYIRGINKEKYSLSVSSHIKLGDIKDIKMGNFLCCKFGVILDKIKNYHIYNLNDIVETKHGNLKIVKQIRINRDRKRNNKNSIISLKGYVVECQKCKHIFDISENDLTNKSKNFGCQLCNDYISYSEKFTTSLLRQLGIKFKRQKRFNWAYIIKGNKKEIKIYDFYFKLNNKQYIIECHGCQHYEKTFETVGGRNLKEEKENDIIKKQLATKNGIDYYVTIDCRTSNQEWVKDNLISSYISTIFYLDNIDWDECNRFANKSIMYEVCCDYEKSKDLKFICSKYFLDNSTIRKYLKRGIELGISTYDPIKEKKLSYIKMHQATSTSCICLNTLKKFNSISDASLFYSTDVSSISSCCRNKRQSAGKHPQTREPLKWMYYEDYSKLHNTSIS